MIPEIADKTKNNISLIKFILGSFIFVLFLNLNLIKSPFKPEKKILSYKNCHLYLDNSNIRIVHLIITRFLMLFWSQDGFPNKLYKDDYIPNGIRVMKKYLLSSLENQSCNNFSWILMLGNHANITYVKSLINFNNSFKKKIIYEKDFKNYVRNITKGFDVLITTRIDYDDIIYYDAVNDIRKAININRPMFLYGYNRGVMYFESYKKYCDYFYKTYKNGGTMSIFASLITVLNKVNDTYTIYDLGSHDEIRKTILEKYKSFGIKELNYDPALFDSGTPKFAYVRQKNSINYIRSEKKIKKGLKLYNFNINKFYGKY